MLPKKVFLQCFCRSWCVGAAMSSRYMQRAGLLYALDPALQALYTQAEPLREARRRYMQHIRTHNLMAPLLVSICIALEMHVARKEVPAKNVGGLLHTTATTLSAIGDSFFSGSVLVLWALGCFLCFLHGLPNPIVEDMSLIRGLVTLKQGTMEMMLVWTSLLLTLVILFQSYMFFVGIKYSLGALQKMRTFDLINGAERIKFCNVLLLIYIFWHMIDGETLFYWGNEVWAVFCLLIAVLLIQRAHVPRLILVSVLFMALFLESIKPVIS